MVHICLKQYIYTPALTSTFVHGYLISGYWGCAAGKAKSAAKTELEKIKMTEMTCAELIKEAAKIIYQV